MIAPATEAELGVARRMRSRSILTMHGKRFVKHLAGDGFVESSRLEALGLVEQWPQPSGAILWCATDQPPSFERPHWRCELAPDDTRKWHGDRYALTVEVAPGHPALVSLFYVPDYARDDVDALAFYLADTVENAQREIARAIALRSAGDPCECGGCE